MPSTYSIMCGSMLNKDILYADELWGKEWSKISSALQVYALGDLKHGWMV